MQLSLKFPIVRESLHFVNSGRKYSSEHIFTIWPPKSKPIKKKDFQSGLLEDNFSKSKQKKNVTVANNWPRIMCVT